MIIESETIEEIVLDTSTISLNITEENNVTINLDENLPILNYSNETFIQSTRSISASNRQIRQIVSYCKELPQIEHAQLLIDNTIKYNLSNEIMYSGSLVFICQFGFISDSSDNEPFQLTCQNGVFHPKIICIGKIIFLIKKFIHCFFLFAKKNLDVHYHHQLIRLEVQLLIL